MNIVPITEKHEEEKGKYVLQCKKDMLKARIYNTVNIQMQSQVQAALDRNGLQVFLKAEENYDGL